MTKIRNTVNKLGRKKTWNRRSPGPGAPESGWELEEDTTWDPAVLLSLGRRWGN